MRVTFTETKVVDDHRKGTPDEERYEKGRTYDLSEAAGGHWIGRNVAVPAQDNPAETAPQAAGTKPARRRKGASRPKLQA